MPSQRALELQAELQRLKAAHRGLRIRKTPATDAAPGGAPFPITLELAVDAPPGTRIDVERLVIRITLAASALAPPPPPTAAAISVSGEPPLPPRLAAEAARRLHAAWAAAAGANAGGGGGAGGAGAGGAASFGLAEVVEAAARQYSQIIGCMPEYLEPYEGVDEHGATVRRFALVAAVQAQGGGVDSGGEEAAPEAGPPLAPAQPPPPLPQQQKQQQVQQQVQQQPKPASSAASGPASAGPAAAARPAGPEPTEEGSTAAATDSGGGQPLAARPRGAAPRRLVVARPPVLRPQGAGGAEADLRWLSARFGQALSITGAGAGSGDGGDGGGAGAGSGGASGSGGGGGAGGEGPAGPHSFSLMLRPTDPVWGAARGAIHVTGEWPAPPRPAGPQRQPRLQPDASAATAASGCPRLRVLPTVGVPFPLAMVLEEELQRQVAATAAAGNAGSALRSALTWLEGYAGMAAADAGAGGRLGGPFHERQRQEGESGRARRGAAGGSEAGTSSGGGGGSEGPSGSGSEGTGSDYSSSEGAGSGSSSSSGSDEDDSGGGVGARRGGASSSAAAPEQHSGGGGAYGIALEGLSLDQIDALEALQAHVQVECARCGAPATADLEPGGGRGASGGGGAPRTWEWHGGCGKCGGKMWALLRPRIVHERSNEIGALKAEGCRPLDLLPSLFGAQCADCSASVALRNVQVGLPSSRNCTHCHKQLTLLIPAVAFIPKRPPAAGSAQARARAGPRTGGEPGARRKGGGGQAVAGQPLPFLGTCKHYRHSHRWLRFPCCGQRFPCDICHEEGTDGHEMAWAKRMTCGYCGVEQAVADRCAACDKRLASSASNPSGRSTRFWEGGQGCRDVNSMSRKDPHRYRNSKAKTRSAKSSRVGPKPWSGAKSATTT